MEYGYEQARKKREVWEAIQAGEQALDHLRQAKKSLDSAENWGLLDIFGGNLFSGIMKHSRIDDAKRSMANAKHALDAFRKELEDVDEPEMHLDLDNFITFADFFFDGILMDVLVQSKIGKAREQVNDAISRVQDMVTRLRELDQLAVRG